MFQKVFNSAVVYLKEVRTELSKTSFPTRELTVKNTIIVLAFSLAVAIFLGALDSVFSYLLSKYII